MHKSELKQIYLDTLYSIFYAGHEYQINVGELLAKEINDLLENTKNQSAIIFTAWNPRSTKVSNAENQQNNNELSQYLIKNNFIHYAALGKGRDQSWTAEESFFILDVNEGVGELLALKYQQNAYILLEKNKPAALIFSAVWKN